MSNKNSSMHESSIDLEEVEIKSPDKPNVTIDIKPAANKKNVRMTPID